MRLVLALVFGCVLAGCQDDVTTPFPDGLQPFEDNPVDLTTELGDETLLTSSVDGSEVKVYGRGYVAAAPAELWALAKNPPAMAAVCSTDAQSYTEDDEPAYEYSFLVHYTVHNVLTVEWDDAWRYGVVEGTQDAVKLGMIRHQKIQGSDFITTSEGTVQVLETPDPGVSELDFVEHLEAVSGGVSDVKAGMLHNYDALVALAHGQSIPGCH